MNAQKVRNTRFSLKNPPRNLLFHKIKPTLAIRRDRVIPAQQKGSQKVVPLVAGETRRISLKQGHEKNINIKIAQKVAKSIGESKEFDRFSQFQRHKKRLSQRPRSNDCSDDSYLLSDPEVTDLFIKMREKLRFSRYKNGRFFSPQKLLQKCLEIDVTRPKYCTRLQFSDQRKALNLPNIIQ
ncbi:unnamed protein product [Moneuplotes crassus]|uniref:Uncharacterized protein n=1 Tax=Euplotes crassus TaxID=5936 RepID=A0AAD1XMJ2_EUPCR|nr:unnamed protein product [Moneuplotes crassus]